MSKPKPLQTIVDLVLWINEEVRGYSIGVVAVGNGYNVVLMRRGKAFEGIEFGLTEAYLIAWLNGYLSALTRRMK